MLIGLPLPLTKINCVFYFATPPRDFSALILLESALVCPDNNALSVGEEIFSGATGCLRALLSDWKETGKCKVVDSQ
jgi:hypothetical protein